MQWNKRSLLQKINYYFLAILGFIFILLFIYYTFIRERLPKIIPFMLKEYSFFIIVYICLLYIFIIYRIIYPPSNNKLLANLFSYIGIPFSTFDSFIKQNKFIYPYFYEVFKYLPSKLKNWTEFHHKFLFISFNILPRIILILIFSIDVFWFHNIKNFYLFIPISLLPLFYRYFIFSVEIMIMQYLKTLEELYEKVIMVATDTYITKFTDDLSFGESAPYHLAFVTLQEYLNIQVEVLILNDKDTIIYEGTVLSKETIYIEYCTLHKKKITELNDDDNALLQHEFNTVMPRLIDLQYFLNIHKKVCNNIYIKIINCIIYVAFFCCWSYILVASIHTIKSFVITLTILNFIITNYKIFLTIKLSLLYIGLKLINNGKK